MKYNSTIVINERYNTLASFIEQIPTIFDSSGELLYSGRNVVKLFYVEGVEVVVKSFKCPPLINRFVYAHIRGSKAKRSYDYATYFLARGFLTPHPIAYIDCISKGLLNESYYVCLHTHLPSIDTIIEEGSDVAMESFYELGHFANKLHRAGIYHNDFNTTNILYSKSDGKTHFTLIDLNRTSFGNYSLRRGIYDLRRLKIGAEYYKALTRGYAEASGKDEREIIERVTLAREMFVKRENAKNRLKKF